MSLAKSPVRHVGIGVLDVSRVSDRLGRVNWVKPRRRPEQVGFRPPRALGPRRQEAPGPGQRAEIGDQEDKELG